MSNIYYDGKSYYRIDANGNRIPASRQSNMSKDSIDHVVRKSTTGNRTKNKPRTIRVYADRAKAAIVTLCCVCIIATTGVTMAGINAVNDFRDAQIVSNYSREFRINAVNDNTKRTFNNKYFYYEYDDIYDEGKEYFQEKANMSEKDAEDATIYFANRQLGNNQMERFFNEGVHGVEASSIDEYVENKGFDSIDEWRDSVEEKLVFLHEANEKGYQLQQMVDEAESNAKEQLGLNDGYGGK